MIRNVVFLFTVLANVVCKTHSFLVVQPKPIVTPMSGVKTDDDSNSGMTNFDESMMSRLDFLSKAAMVTSFALTSGGGRSVARAEESTEQPVVAAVTTRTIDGCPKEGTVKNDNCIATSNIKQLDRYSPPWTYEVSADEAFARLKGALTADGTMTITEMDKDNFYIKAENLRNSRGTDEMEFLIKADDKVVVFKSNEKEDSFDFDVIANRARLEALRKKAAVFDLMGGGMTADSFVGDLRKNNGVFGQLNSFFGYNNGEGFEDVFDK